MGRTGPRAATFTTEPTLKLWSEAVAASITIWSGPAAQCPSVRFNGLKRGWLEAVPNPNRPPPPFRDRLAVLVEQLRGVAVARDVGDRAGRGRHAGKLSHARQQVLRDRRVAARRLLHDFAPRDHRARVLVRAGEDVVERLLDRVGEDER